MGLFHVIQREVSPKEQEIHTDKINHRSRLVALVWKGKGQFQMKGESISCGYLCHLH